MFFFESYWFFTMSPIAKEFDTVFLNKIDLIVFAKDILHI